QGAGARRRRRQGEAESATPRSPAAEAEWREVQAVLDEEIQRLPATYREPFVLCCLENHSRTEAARRLGVKEGTIGSRLTGARQRLRDRLARRGVALSAVLAAVALARPAGAAVPSRLAASAGRAGGQVRRRLVANDRGFKANGGWKEGPRRPVEAHGGTGLADRAPRNGGRRTGVAGGAGAGGRWPGAAGPCGPIRRHRSEIRP